MNNPEIQLYTITNQNTQGIQGGPERTMTIEGPTTQNQTMKLAYRLTPLLLTFLAPLQAVLSNIGGIPSSDDQIILSLSDSEEFNATIRARFDVINSKEIRFIQSPLNFELPSPLPQITEIIAGISWYRPTRFALFKVGTPTLYEYFELRCHSSLWLRLGTSRSTAEAPIPGPPVFTNSLIEILTESHGIKIS